ncbi:MAG: alpha/beta hydrolase-fold protein [Acidobacteriota bacterium]|nr:alpha/beta hydrolase-fold protein [Acidobacteriota bacterium]
MRKEFLSAAGSLLANAVKGKIGERQGSIESRIVEIDSDEYNYQIYVPADVQTKQRLPVIIFLHGIGQRGSGGFVPTSGAGGVIARHYFGQVPAIVLLPQCRQGSYWSDAIMDKMVMRALAQTLEEFGADENRVYLTGVSMGGYGVWHFAAAYPNKFAALVSICGGSSFTKGDRFSPLAEKVGKTPAWLFHGADDKVVAVGESRQIVAALKANEGNVKYNEYAGVGHNVWMNAATEKDLMSWLLEQHLG